MRFTNLAVLPLALLGWAVPAHAQTASPQPTPTPHRDYVCPTVSVSAPQAIDSGAEARIAVTGDGYGNAIDLSLRRIFPTPIATVRHESSATNTVWTVRLGESHRFQASASYQQHGCAGGGAPVKEFAIDVRPNVTVQAVRSAPRDYAFYGRVSPGRGQRVTLWRVEPDGRRVLTATGTVGPNGTYRIVRKFAGSGRFGFQVDVAATEHNLAGRSPVRPTVIH